MRNSVSLFSAVDFKQSVHLLFELSHIMKINSAMASIANKDTNEKQEVANDIRKMGKSENAKDNVKSKYNVKAASSILTNYGKVKRKKCNVSKNKGKKNTHEVQNSLTQMRRPSSNTKNLKDKMKLVCLIGMATEDSQIECFERSIENAITALEDASHKLKELKKPNEMPMKETISK